MFGTQTSAFRARKNVLVVAWGLLVAVAGCGGGGSSDSSGGGRLQNKIVYAADASICTVNPDGTERNELFVDSNWGGQGDSFESLTPSVSPDGSRIVFKRYNILDTDGVSGKLLEFWVINANGSGLRRIAAFDYGVNVDYPRFSPDGSKIIFIRLDKREIEEYPHSVTGNAICVMNASGGEPTVIAQGEYYRNALFSPDGSKILYGRSFHDSATNNDTSNVYTRNADGTGETLLATDAADPAFSPDGSRIVYVSNSEIYTMNADGSAQTRVTTDNDSDRIPSFSPDGTKILYASTRGLGYGIREDNGNGLLYTMNTDGSEITRLLAGKTPVTWYQVTGQAWVGATTR